MLSERVYKFPVPDSPSSMGSTKWQILRGRFRETVGRLMTKLRAPGAIRDTEIDDTLTGQNIRIRVGYSFTRITIDGRDYYFDRLTGRFDGTGSGCR